MKAKNVLRKEIERVSVHVAELKVSEKGNLSDLVFEIRKESSIRKKDKRFSRV